MKNFLKKTGHSILSVVIHIAYKIWTLGTWILYRPKITYEDGADKACLKQPCILIANHTSHKDGSFVPQALCRCKMYVLVTSKWYDKKMINVFFKNLRYIPINLNEMDNSWIDTARKVMENGYSVLIFPEGKLSKDGKLGEFYPGFLMLSRLTDAPVIPVAVSGGYRKLHRQHILIGRKIDFDVHKAGRPSLIMKEGAEVCRQQMERMLEEINHAKMLKC